MIKKIISGGQTGVDQAALDVAIKLGIPHGGWIPKGRMTENAPLSDKYQLQEMATTEYSKRTQQNIIDSDGTLIISHGELTGGSALTRKLATRHRRPWLYVDLDRSNVDPSKLIKSWVGMNAIKILNVTGPRESKSPRIYDTTVTVLENALTQKRRSRRGP